MPSWKTAPDVASDSGVPRRAFQVAAVASAALVLVLLSLHLMAARASSGRSIGVGVEDIPSEGMLLTAVETGFPAELAGLQVGDLVTAVGGQPIESVGDYDAIAARFSRGDQIVFAVLRQGRGMTLEVQPGVDYPWAELLPTLIGALAYLGIAILSLFPQPWDIRARLLWALSIAVAVELALPLHTVGDPVLSLWVQGAFLLLTGMQLGFELHLATVIPTPQDWLKKHPWVVPGFYLLGTIVSLALLVPFLLEELGSGWIWGSGTAIGLWYDIGMPLWAIGVVALLARPALTYPEPRGRHQASLVLGGVLPWSAYVLSTCLLDLFGATYPDWLLAVEPLVLLCYPVAIFCAIYRYQLFDIELAVRRTLVYSVLTTALVVGFYLLIGLGGALFSRFLESGGSVWTVGGATLILGLLFAPLRRGVERMVYQKFFPERLALRGRLTELAAELPTLGKLPAMGNHLVSRLEEVFGVRWATLMLADPTSGHLATLSSSLESFGEELEFSLLLPASDPGLSMLSKAGRPFAARQLYAKSPLLARRLQQLKAAYLVPLTREDRLVGLMVLGPKESEEDYQAEELDLLNLLAHHVVSVFDNARLFESATRDSLTGLLRREVVLEILQTELQRAVRHGRPLALGMADLDYFKEINDRYGHLTGDAVLRWVSHNLRTGLRTSDFVGRYGGEEFLVVLPETDMEGASQVAEKVRGLVEERGLTTDQGQWIKTTLSIGLSAIEPGESRTAYELIEAADQSLYDAKLAGRNRVFPTLPPAG